jgi:hypothetical protein
VGRDMTTGCGTWCFSRTGPTSSPSPTTGLLGLWRAETGAVARVGPWPEKSRGIAREDHRLRRVSGIHRVQSTRWVSGADLARNESAIIDPWGRLGSAPGHHPASVEPSGGRARADKMARTGARAHCTGVRTQANVHPSLGTSSICHRQSTLGLRPQHQASPP